MSNSFVSVIVCTYNRGKYLDKSIQSLKLQSYTNFEIIVVNGPSTDNTDEVLKKYDHIKIIQQDKLNGLSYARNLGIAISKGEIIAFIDDDATADKDWLKNLVSGYVDESVGGVGGYVYDPWGNVQFDNGCINKNGIPIAIRDAKSILKPDEYQISMGTNCSFRRKVLYEVGGFDPYFKYYHDESELCVRIALKGYKILYQPNAIVLHEMAEGPNRKTPYDLDWTEIVKNVIYFTLKNFNSELSSYTIRPLQALYWWFRNFYHLYNGKKITFKQLIRIYRKILKGAVQGYRDGYNRHKNKNYLDDINASVLIDSPHKFSSGSTNVLKICFMAQEYSKNCSGGTCKHTYELAHALSDLGNEVHVITKSDKDYNYDTKDGKVYVHKIVPINIDFLGIPEDMGVTKKNIAYSYTTCLKLLDLIDEYGIHVAEAPLWDAEGFVFSLVKDIPLFIRLQTPLYKVAETQNWVMNKDLKFVNWLEGETIRRANKAIAISNGIGELISAHHHVPKDAITLCPLGILLPELASLSSTIRTKDFKILFVGRFETRKGIDTIFRSIPAIIDRIPDTTFYFIGSDTDLAPGGGSYKDYLLKGIDNKYHKNIRFVGYVDTDTLNVYYRDCDIFIAPSLYESFGIIYLEAMSWGKPVIGCNVGGIPEVVKDGETGILIEPGNDKQLTEAIITLLTDTNLRSKMGKNARLLMENKFSSKVMAENTIKIYKDAINGHI